MSKEDWAETGAASRSSATSERREGAAAAEVRRETPARQSFISGTSPADLERRLGRGADLLDGDARRALDEDEASALLHVEDGEVGDDPVDAAAAR